MNKKELNIKHHMMDEMARNINREQGKMQYLKKELNQRSEQGKMKDLHLRRVAGQ